MAKKSNTAKATETKTEVKAPETVKLADIARAEGANPKAVRARFRKMYAADDTSHLPQSVKGGSRWTFASKDREALAKLVNATSDSSDGE